MHLSQPVIFLFDDSLYRNLWELRSNISRWERLFSNPVFNPTIDGLSSSEKKT